MKNMELTETDYDTLGDVEYADYYDDENYPFQFEDSVDYDNEGTTTEPFSFNELYNYCILPTLGDSYTHLLGILAWSFLFLVSSRLVRLPAIVIHICSSLFGFAVLWQMFALRTAWMGALFGVSYLSLLFGHYVLRKWRGPFSSFNGVLFLILCELLLAEPIWWHALRGIQMIILMKVVSVGYDLDSGQLKQIPNPVEMAGYVLTPGTVVFGPWIPFSTYNKVTGKLQWSINKVAVGAYKMMLSLFFLICSTCLVNWIIPDGSNRWLMAYRDALSFRTSHYFVSHLSEVSSSLSGIESVVVSKPLSVEVPRSLVEVVVFWNMPMHHWLKTYVFKPSKKRVGSFTAVVLTYAMSTLFHGINFQLGAVLLSLSFYTYTEHSIRGKIAHLIDACVLARPCSGCEHKNKASAPLAIVVNVAFGLLTVFHLAYLGMMFDSSRDMQEKGYSIVHTIRKWSELNYFSHWITLSMYSLMSVL